MVDRTGFTSRYSARSRIVLPCPEVRPKRSSIDQLYGDIDRQLGAGKHGCSPRLLEQSRHGTLEYRQSAADLRRMQNPPLNRHLYADSAERWRPVARGCVLLRCLRACREQKRTDEPSQPGGVASAVRLIVQRQMSRQNEDQVLEIG